MFLKTIVQELKKYIIHNLVDSLLQLSNVDVQRFYFLICILLEYCVHLVSHFLRLVRRKGHQVVSYLYPRKRRSQWEKMPFTRNVTVYYGRNLFKTDPLRWSLSSNITATYWLFYHIIRLKNSLVTLLMVTFSSNCILPSFWKL